MKKYGLEDLLNLLLDNGEKVEIDIYKGIIVKYMLS
jgi:hypothetical protein